MLERITYARYQEMLLDVETPDELIARYSIADKGEGAFDPVIRPNPELVIMSQAQVEAESAMQIGNGLARFRRQRLFGIRRASPNKLPILVSEGDSWFQFPVFINEVIDNLDRDYLIWSIGAAGDTAQNMVFNDIGRGKTEYMRALKRFKGEVRAFLFSAAGNDVIGEDPRTGEPVLAKLLRPFQPGTTDPRALIDQTAVTEVLDFLERAYRKVIGDVRGETGLERLPILIHAYDYVFPFPWGANDPRDPTWADKNAWLGQPLDAKGILEPALRRGVLKELIDQLYVRFEAVAADHQGVWVVDCRGAMPDVDDWADEIHGTSKGFAKVADRFAATLRAALSPVA